jgi:hypothetical protein
VAQDEHGHVLADGDFQLGNAHAQLHRVEQLAKLGQQPGDRGRQDLAGERIRDEARSLLVETDQHRALLLDVMHGKPRAIAIAPRGPHDGGQDAIRRHLPEPREVVLEHALLRRHLRGRIHVLHRASTAHSEIAATRRHAKRALAQHLPNEALVESPAAAAPLEQHALAGDPALEEGDLSVDVRDADPLVVEGFDDGFGQLSGRCRSRSDWRRRSV